MGVKWIRSAWTGRSLRAEDDRWPRKSTIKTSTAERLSDESVLAEAEAILGNPEAFLPAEVEAVA